jgi:RND family efflux transporter MFP subunit
MIPDLCRPTARLFGLLLCCLLVGCARNSPAPEEPAIAPVQEQSPRLLTLAEWTDLLGTTQPLPNRVARVTAVVEGLVLPFGATDKSADNSPNQSTSVIEGQIVKAGDVVLRLDTRLIEERRKQADNAVRLAEVDVKRLAELYASSPQLVSPVEREKAQLAMEDAMSKRKAIEDEYKFYTLRAPISGRLGLFQVVPGQTIPIGTTVADVVDLDEIDVLCFVPPSVAARLALNQPARTVRLKKDGQLAPSPPTGKVAFIAVQAQPETGNIAVKVRFPNPSLELRANTVVRVQVMTQPEEPRLTIPDSALMEDMDPPGVVVVEDLNEVKNKDGKPEERGKARKLRVKIGVRDQQDHRVEVLALMTDKNEPVPIESAHFIVKGANGLQDGDPVRITQEEDE